MEDCLYQKWLCEIKIAEMHPQHRWEESSDSAVFYLKFWENGGISGTKVEKGSSSASDIFAYIGIGRSAADVFGEWTDSGLSLTVVTRRQDACKWELQGKWEEKLERVSEGKFNVTKGSPIPGWTIPGTFKLTAEKKGTHEAKEKSSKGVFIQNMKQYIGNSQEDKHFYDFKINAKDGSEVQSHKIILASQSKYFAALFRQENPDSVELDFPGDIIEKCVNYIYTEDIDVNGDNVQDVMVFANYIAIPEILRVCEEFIVNNLDLSTCVDVLKLGDYLGNSAIIEEAKNLICRNFQTLFSSNDELQAIPLHLFKQILSSDKLVLYSKYNTILPGVEREEMLGEYIEKHFENNVKDVQDMKNLLRTDKKHQIKCHRELSHLKTWNFCSRMGNAGDNPKFVKTVSAKGEGKKFISHITICTVEWDPREVIGGLTLRWSDGSSDTVGSMAEAGSPFRTEMKVPEGEHISLVFGNSGWYVDTLTFVASSGRKIGEISPSDGGSFINPLCTVENKFNSSNTYLDGLQADVVISLNKKIVTNLRFIYSMLTNGEDPKPRMHVPDDEGY